MLYRSLARGLVVSAVVLAGLGGAEAARQGGGRDRADRAGMSDRECLARAMYFESDRNAEDGMLAVGTIVMNRLDSGRYGSRLCGVVAQYAQFAPGVLTRRMAEARPAQRARKVADAVLKGSRHPVAGDVMFFHTANVPFRNHDKRYVLVSGGNAFYQWNRDDDDAQANLRSFARAFDEADEAKDVGEKVVSEASEPRRFVAVAQIVEAPAAPVETPVASPLPRVEDATVARPELLALTLAYRSVPERTPEANAALATVMTLGPKRSKKPLQARGPRVIEVAEPVLASSAPAFLSRRTDADPMANMIVTAAWTVFR